MFWCLTLAAAASWLIIRGALLSTRRNSWSGLGRQRGPRRSLQDGLPADNVDDSVHERTQLRYLTL